MDPRDALDETLKLFGIKATTLAEASGINPQMISKYRNKHQDMQSINLLSIVASLPRTARFHFYSLIEPEIEESTSITPVAKERAGEYKHQPSAVPPSPYTSYLWQWLSLNQISPSELQTRLASHGINPNAVQEVLAGRSPTAEERLQFNQVLSEAGQADE
ncbi:hypothetical protein AB3R30_18740 [Leptolyngbyaceae cyanobacterium UHCC 1019]